MEYLIEDLKEKTYEDFLKSLTIKKTIKSPMPLMTLSFFADGFAEIKRQENRVNEVLINPITYTSIRKMKHNFIDFKTQRESLLKEIGAYLWGACINISKKIPDNTILLLTEPKYKTTTILKIEKNEKNDLIKIFMEQSSELKTLASQIIEKTEEMDKMIYEITKTEE